LIKGLTYAPLNTVNASTRIEKYQCRWRTFEAYGWPPQNLIHNRPILERLDQLEAERLSVEEQVEAEKQTNQQGKYPNWTGKSFLVSQTCV
jgi:hypothetical protein